MKMVKAAYQGLISPCNPCGWFGVGRLGNQPPGGQPRRQGDRVDGPASASSSAQQPEHVMSRTTQTAVSTSATCRGETAIKNPDLRLPGIGRRP